MNVRTADSKLWLHHSPTPEWTLRLPTTTNTKLQYQLKCKIEFQSNANKQKKPLHHTDLLSRWTGRPRWTRRSLDDSCWSVSVIRDSKHSVSFVSFLALEGGKTKRQRQKGEIHNNGEWPGCCGLQCNHCHGFPGSEVKTMATSKLVCFLWMQNVSRASRCPDHKRETLAYTSNS